MPRYVPVGRGFFALTAIGLLLARPAYSADDPQSAVPAAALPMEVLVTPGGTRFVVCGAKPSAPAPTIFAVAGSVDAVVAGGGTLFTEAATDLTRDGWLYVALDIPCHGADSIAGEPTELSGWAHRVKADQDLFGPYTQRCSEVLDFLIDEGYTDPDRVGATGTSRGGLCALHIAAAEPRVRAVAIVSPVTDPLALSEFSGVSHAQTVSIDAMSLVDALAGRPVSITMGNDDARVSTDSCVQFAGALVKAARQKHPDQKLVPVDLAVGPAEGHTVIEGAYPMAVEFLRRHVSGSAP